MLRPRRHDPAASGTSTLRTGPGRGRGRTPRPGRPVDGPTGLRNGAGARLSRRALGLVVLIAAGPLAGCANVVSPLGQWRAAYNGNLFRKLTPEEMGESGGTADSSNLFQRWLTPRGMPSLRSIDTPTSTLVLGSDGWRPIAKPAPDPVAEAEFQAALKLFKQGKFEEAQKLFAAMAKKYETKGTSGENGLFTRFTRNATKAEGSLPSPWAENALFYLAECQYQLKRYTDAHETYEKLAADHPGTNYMQKLTERELELGRLWLAQTDPKTPPEKKLPWQARFDGRLPWIDTQGLGITALEHAQHNDPLGPSSDKAAIEIADFHMKHNDFETASILYESFITEWAGRKTPYLQYAQLAAIDARMKSYQGPDYDSSCLDKARGMTIKTMETFPERQASFEKLYLTIDHINDANAEKVYQIGMQYKRMKKVASAEYYLGWVPQRWPNSPWAVKAKAELVQLAKMPRTPSKPSKIIIPPGATDPSMGSGPMGGMGMGGMGMGGMGMGGMGMGGMGGGMM